MVVYNTYIFSSVIEVIIILIFAIFFVYKREETLGKAIRLATSSILLFITVFQLPMEVKLGKPYNLTFIMIIIWFALAIITVAKFHQKE